MKETTALDILIAARAKIAKPEDWGKGQRNKDRSIETYCAAEAIQVFPRVWGDGSFYRACRWALDTFKAAAGNGDEHFDLVDWNDAPERTHTEVLAAFDLAIALERNTPRASSLIPAP